MAGEQIPGREVVGTDGGDSLTSVSPMTVFALWQKVALGQRWFHVWSSLCWGVKGQWCKAISCKSLRAVKVIQRGGRRGTNDNQKSFRELGMDLKWN